VVPRDAGEQDRPLRQRSVRGVSGAHQGGGAHRARGRARRRGVVHRASCPATRSPP
jgi:hypothetical protein